MGGIVIETKGKKMSKKTKLSGLANINIELTSRCNKNCWMCGRRKIDKEYPEIALDYGDMDFSLVKRIAKQLAPNMVVQLHNNGEPLLYENFGNAISLFKRQITSIDTNGKLLLEKSKEIIGNLDTMAISIFENDEEQEEQFKIIDEFLKIKRDKKPYTILRINGNVDIDKYKKFKLLMTSRVLHAPLGSFNYKKRTPTIPEIGICLDFLHHLAINSNGEVSICVRFDPKKKGVIGDATKESLESIWNSSKRMKWLEYHKQGKREKIPLCSYCHFWGVPTNNKDVDNQILKINEKQSLNKGV